MWIKNLYPFEYVHIEAAKAFHNPAENFAEQRLSLGDLPHYQAHSTFVVRSNSKYTEAGIMQSSVITIDRPIRAQHTHIIGVEVDGKLVFC